MTLNKNNFYFASIVVFLTSIPPWLGCSYKYRDNYNYAKENAPYLEATKDTAFTALLADTRVKSILNGTDADAKKSLQTLLDKLEAFQASVDGVAYAALIEAVLANSAVTAANIKTTTSTLVTLMTAIASQDHATAIASSVRGDGAGDTARIALSAYANERNNASVENMMHSYYNAISGSLSTLASSAPLGSAIIFAGSSQAIAGDDGVDATTKALKNIGTSTVGDTAVETQKTGVALIALIIDQTTAVLDAAAAADLTAASQQTMILAMAQVIHSAGQGLTQVAAVVETRVEENMIQAKKSDAAIATANGLLKNIFTLHTQIAEQSRTTTKNQTDAALTKNINGALARLTQLISFIDTEAEVTAGSDSCTKLLATIANANAANLLTFIKASNTALAKKITYEPSEEVEEEEETRTYKFIYTTQSLFEGDLITAATTAGGTVAHGIAAADYLCQADSNYPGSGTYKALIIDNTYSRRIACTTANCSGGASEHVDWVLAANTEYRRLDGTTSIDTTSSIGLFTYDLDNSMSDTTVLAWTGMMGNWTSRNYDCGGWDGSTTEGDAGDISSTLTNAVGHTWNFCTGDLSPLICVEQ